MATITNNEARLIWAPKVSGHPAIKWLPGKNRLDETFWKAAQHNNDVKRWIKLGWLSIDMNDDMPDPTIPPTDAELAGFTDTELGAALKNPNVPVQWHPVLEGELAKRADAKRADVSKRLPPVTPPTDKDRKSLLGLRVEECLPLIAAETDVDTLEAWGTSDKRKTIDEAIDARLAELALDGDEG